jgi:hypothetical protein
MKTYKESGNTASQFLTSALDGGERSASRTGRFACLETAVDSHRIRGDNVDILAKGTPLVPAWIIVNVDILLT